jgi:serine protease Do
MHDTVRKYLFTGGAGAFALLVPCLLAGQGAVRTKTSARKTAPFTNACAELASSPSRLVNVPEGMALLRMKRELESVAALLERESQMEREQVQRFSQLQRGMDSAISIVVRGRRDDGGEMSIMVRRGDSVRTMDARRFEVRRDSLRPMERRFDVRLSTGNVDSALRFMGVVSDSSLHAMGPQVTMLIRSLQPQVAAFSEAAEAHLPMRSVMPGGYMGLSLSGAQLRIVTPEGVMTSHCEYPMVESVDAGSPAERAGLAAGDTLLAYNGRDVVQQAVNYPEMLVPGQQVRVRVRRSGRSRDVPVTVAERKEERAMTFMRTFEAPVGVPSRTGRVMVTGAPVPPAPVASMLNGSAVAVIAGAQFASMDADLAQTFNLEPGVLVLRVPAGTPAADAGLRTGDVVRSVNGTAVRDITVLRRVMSGEGRDLRLQVQSRTGERTVERTVTLRLR